jgi:hypothetical protein
MKDSVEKPRYREVPRRDKVQKLENSTHCAVPAKRKTHGTGDVASITSDLWNGDISEIDPIKAFRTHLNSERSSLRRTYNCIRTGRGKSSEHESAWRGGSKIRFV